MARRVLEKELLQKEGKPEFAPLGTPKTMKVVKEIDIHKSYRGVFSLQFNYTGEVLAVGYGSGGIELFDSATGNFLKELRPCRQGGESIMAIRFHPKQPNILYAATTKGEVLVINTITSELLQTIEERLNEINTLDFCVDGYNFVTGGRDLGIRVYETKNNRMVTHYEGLGKGSTSDETRDRKSVMSTMRIFCAKFHPDNQFLFVSGGWDNHLKIWDIRSNDGIKRIIIGPHICGDSIDMKGNEILTGQWTALHALQEYNYTTGKIVKELKYPHKDGAFLYCAQYCNDDLVVAGGSGTNKAELIQLSTNTRCLGFDLGCSIQAIDTARNGRLLAVGGAANKFFILNVSA